MFSDYVNWSFGKPLLRAINAIIGGENDVPNVDPIFPNPIIDIGNSLEEEATVLLPTEEYIIAGIGSPFEIGSRYGGFSFLGQILGLRITEFSGIVRDTIDADLDDNDVEQILVEILTGQSGAKFDFETEPGIDGVELVGLTPETFTLALTTVDGTTDRLTFGGPGTRSVLETLDSDANIGDSTNAISIVDLATETVELGGQLADLLGTSFAGSSDAETLFNASFSDPRITLLSQMLESFSIRIDVNGLSDYIVFIDSVDGLPFL